jgi:hypothetical protein
MDRYDRNIRFFGAEGQRRLRAASVAIIGCGGLGTHVAQQLALLGIGRFFLIDDEDLDDTNRNRYIGAKTTDLIPGSRKVNLAERTIHEIDPAIEVQKFYGPLRSPEAFQFVRTADYVFGCLDNEGSRLVLTELSAAYDRPYFDLASDIIPVTPPMYGGRVCVAWHGDGCPVCLNVIDMEVAQKELADEGVRKDMDSIYGVDRHLLDEKGPSVVSINGVIASIAVTEFVVAVTEIRPPKRLITYYGHRGVATASVDAPTGDCYYCRGIHGKKAGAGVERFLLMVVKKISSG